MSRRAIAACKYKVKIEEKSKLAKKGPMQLVKKTFDSHFLKKEIFEIKVDNKKKLQTVHDQNHNFPRICFMKSYNKNLFPQSKSMELIELTGGVPYLPKDSWKGFREECKIKEVSVGSCRRLLRLFMFRQLATRFRLIRGVTRQDLLNHKYQILKSLKKKYSCRAVVALRKNGKPLAFSFVYCKKKTLWLYELMSGNGVISRIAGLEAVLENLKYFAGKISRVKTNVYGHNLPAIAIFKKLGLSPGRRSFYMLLQK